MSVHPEIQNLLLIDVIHNEGLVEEKEQGTDDRGNDKNVQQESICIQMNLHEELVWTFINLNESISMISADICV